MLQVKDTTEEENASEKIVEIKEKSRKKKKKSKKKSKDAVNGESTFW